MPALRAYCTEPRRNALESSRSRPKPCAPCTTQTDSLHEGWGSIVGPIIQPLDDGVGDANGTESRSFFFSSFELKFLFFFFPSYFYPSGFLSSFWLIPHRFHRFHPQKARGFPLFFFFLLSLPGMPGGKSPFGASYTSITFCLCEALGVCRRAADLARSR